MMDRLVSLHNNEVEPEDKVEEEGVEESVSETGVDEGSSPSAAAHSHSPQPRICYKVFLDDTEKVEDRE